MPSPTPAAPAGSTAPGIILDELRRTRPWLLGAAMLFALMGLVGLVQPIGIMLGFYEGALPGGMGAFQIGIGLLSTLVYGILAWWQWQSGRAMATAAHVGTSDAVEVAMQGQRNFWRLCGWLALVVLVASIVGTAMVSFAAIGSAF